MQLSFDFPFQEKYLPEDFVVSNCNKSAFEFVKNYDSTNEISPRIFPRIFGIFAPKFAGKSYLANMWAKKFAAEFLYLKELEDTNLNSFIRSGKFYIIEDVNEIKNQELLLEIFNLIQEKSAFLMMTSLTNLNLVGLKIKDLNSRLKNVFQIEITKPDDELIKMLLTKNFAEKQLKVSKKVIDFLTYNLPRDFAGVFDVVKIVEFYVVEKKRKITIPLIKEIMKI